MSLFRTLRGAVFGGSMLALVAGLGACTFSPVYSDNQAVQSSYALAYAKPNSRLEQVVYAELQLRLGSSTSPTAPLAAVSIGQVYSETMLSQTASPSKPREVTVTATLTVTPRDGSGAPIKTFTRRVTASYTANDQVLTDRSTEAEAAERAAKAAAESLRLAILAGQAR